ncbi:hypothetical protein [Mucilaginibacter sp. CSA2-8R]|uniref:hypothetical protein n=1 Tax=Mucilaginibacter sp. CSA2-8R TaxID=3141542 RepID=UPI00315D4C0C
MKRNILQSAVLFSALALASCSTPNKLASTPDKDDDVYFTKAEAAEAPVYRQPIYADRYTNVEQGNGGSDDDDYYYYDSYASRINRFGYSSPFDYYDDYYYGYNNNPYAYNNFGYGGWGGYGGLGYGYGGLGIGLGWGGYGGWGLGYGLGYSPFGYGYGGFSPYSYWGTGFGYGGPYWGVYSAYGSVAKARPYRGSGYPTNYGTGTGRNSSVRSVGYNGAYGNAMSSPVRRPASIDYGNSSYNGGRPSRGVASPQPVYRPQRTEINRPAYQPATMDRGSSSAGSMGSSGGGGGGGSRGGGRPSRP